MYSVHNQLHFLCIWIIELLIQGCLKVATKGSWNKYYYFVFLLARKKLWKIIQDVRSSGGKAFEGFLLQFSWQVFHHKIVSYRGYNSFNSKSRVRRITLLFFFTKIRINVVRKKRRQFFFCTTRKEKRTGNFWLPTSIADLFSKVSKTRYFFLIFFGRYYFFLHCFFQLERKSETKKENINWIDD